jgi:hypothetical protein
MFHRLDSETTSSNSLSHLLGAIFLQPGLSGRISTESLINLTGVDRRAPAGAQGLERPQPQDLPPTAQSPDHQDPGLGKDRPGHCLWQACH